jgi:hypothetical protein
MNNQGKIGFGKSLGFQAQIEGLHLNCCILRENSKNKKTGRTRKNLLEEISKTSSFQKNDGFTYKAWRLIYLTS